MSAASGVKFRIHRSRPLGYNGSALGRLLMQHNLSRREGGCLFHTIAVAVCKPLAENRKPVRASSESKQEASRYERTDGQRESGDPTPPEADIKVTRDLIRAGQLMKIEVLAHVAMSYPNRCSLRELGYSFLSQLVYFLQTSFFLRRRGLRKQG